MSRSVVYFFLALLGGPIVALLVLSIVCNLPWDIGMCGHNAYVGLGFLVPAVWVFFLCVYGFIQVLRMFR
jgi:hypothetical protein